MGERELTPEELEEQQPDLLPEREAMSLLSTDPTPYPAGLEELAASAPGAETGLGAADTATGTASDAADLASTDADASESGSESVTSADRSEQISQSDSAYSAT